MRTPRTKTRSVWYGACCGFFMTFKRTIEDFSCEHCGFEVIGNGFTNHCPKCLWSKHVDVYPGDRAHKCGGLMKPLSLLLEKGEHVLVHKCVRCGTTKRNKAAPNDDVGVFLETGGRS